MLFCINYIHGGFLAGFGAFALWCLPGAIGMYVLSLGVSRIGEELPAPVYALLSGLNAATVGIIALAAVQLSEKAITDKLTRALVFLGGVAGMLYTALWCFPILMTASGLATVVWDYKWLQTFKPFWRRRRASVHTSEEDSGAQQTTATASDPNTQGDDPESSLHLRRIPPLELASGTDTERTDAVLDSDLSARVVPSGIQLKVISWKTGMFVIIGFFLSSITVMVTRSLLKSPPLALSLFSNLYLAGTIIFGGGPVVIPLLREYIVSPGWVSPRNFLLGLALIQSFPGPNFNFAVYLGALSLPSHSLLGAIIGFLGIFTPGIIIVTGVMGLWKVLRSRRWLLSVLRGVNAGAVGLVFTAVYKLWQIGYVDAEHQSGSPLGRDPWWVAVTATSFVGGAWFGLSAPLAILLGGVMGMGWFAAVKS